MRGDAFIELVPTSDNKPVAKKAQTYVCRPNATPTPMSNKIKLLPTPLTLAKQIERQFVLESVDEQTDANIVHIRRGSILSFSRGCCLQNECEEHWKGS